MSFIGDTSNWAVLSASFARLICGKPYFEVSQSQAPKGEGGEGVQNPQSLCWNLACRINSCILLHCDSHLPHDTWSLCSPEHLAEQYLLSWKGKSGRGSCRRCFYASFSLLCHLRVSLAPTVEACRNEPSEHGIEEGQEWMSWRFCYRALLLWSSDQATFLKNKPARSFG